MQKVNSNIAVNYRHSAIGEVLWMLPIIKSISEHHKKKIILFTRPETKAKVLLENENYIKEIIYLPFRKGIYQFKEILLQTSILKKKNINYFYVLEEIVRPCLAARLAGVKNIFGYGKKKQRKYLTQSKYLNDNIYNKHEYVRGFKFLKLLKIKHTNIKKVNISLNFNKLKKTKKKYSKFKKKIFLALQASEKFRTWPIGYFIELVNLILSNNQKYIIFLLCDKSFFEQLKKIKLKIKKNKISKILSLEKYSFDKIKYLMKISDFYVGCDSGPAMLSDYLGTKTFVLYGATAPLPYENKIIPIYAKSKSKRYQKNELIVQNHQKKNSYMKYIYPLKVYKQIKSNLKK